VRKLQPAAGQEEVVLPAECGTVPGCARKSAAPPMPSDCNTYAPNVVGTATLPVSNRYVDIFSAGYRDESAEFHPPSLRPSQGKEYQRRKKA